MADEAGRGPPPQGADETGAQPRPVGESSGGQPRPAGDFTGALPRPVGESSGGQPRPADESSGGQPRPAGDFTGALPRLAGDTTASQAVTIWPPVEPDPTEELVPVQDQPPVAEQFPGIDPQLLTQSVEATAPAPESAVPTWRHQLAALRRDWLSTRYPLLVVAAILFALSLPRATESVVQVIGAYPAVGAFAAVLWALYAFPLIWVITRFDFFEREPAAVIGLGLAWGAVIATSLAVSANQAVFSLLTSAFGEAFTQRWGAALAAPTTEESLKTLGIIAVILLARRGIRSAIDGFVIGAMVGLGFQVFENFVYTGNLLLATGQEGGVRVVLNVFLVRGIGSGLWSHAAYSGVVGLGIGYAFTRMDQSRRRRIAFAAATFALAWFLHFIWNLPAIVEGASAVGIILKAAVIVGLMLVVVMRNAGRESYVYTSYLESVHEPAVITQAEIEDLRTYGRREAAARAAAKTGGEKAADGVRALQRAQADLSVALAKGDVEAVMVARRDIAQARSRIATAAILPPAIGHGWGVAAIWLAVIGVLVPVIGPALAAVAAAIGTRIARQQDAAIADSVKAAWAVIGLSLLVGLALVIVLTRTDVP